MSDSISRLMLALVLLGFLISTTINMYGDIEQLKTENQRLSHELSQLRSNYQMVVQERDAARSEIESLKVQFNALQTAYSAENQTRLKAEADAANYKSMVLNMAKNGQTVSPAACLSANQQVTKPGERLLSSIAPVGASSLITLAMVGLVVTMINYSRKQKKLRNLPPQIKNLR